MGETSAQSLIARQVIVRETGFRMTNAESSQPAIHEIWQALVADRDRLRLVASDILTALKEERFPLVLSDRKDHSNCFSPRLRQCRLTNRELAF
jgi:hypothetical protein